jgi:hypothetical protein
MSKRKIMRGSNIRIDSSIFKSSVEEQMTKPVKRRTSGSKRFTKKTKK